MRPETIEFTTTLYTTEAKSRYLCRKVVKPKIEQSLRVESILTATNPHTKSNMQVAHNAEPLPSQIAYKFYTCSLRHLILVNLLNSKSNN